MYSIWSASRANMIGERYWRTYRWRSFYGAKIGVIGANGSGKSSLLKVMAGLKTHYIGDVHVAPNTKTGYLPQEPELDKDKDVQGNVDEGVAEARKILDRYDELCGLLGEDMPPERKTKLEDEFDRVQTCIDTNDLWELGHHVEMAMDALRLPPGDIRQSCSKTLSVVDSLTPNRRYHAQTE